MNPVGALTVCFTCPVCKARRECVFDSFPLWKFEQMRRLVHLPFKTNCEACVLVIDIFGPGAHPQHEEGVTADWWRWKPLEPAGLAAAHAEVRA